MVIYKFNLDKSGVVVAESVRKPWKSSLGSQIIDTCFQETDACTKYEKGRILAVNDIYNSHLSECHIQLLEEFNVKANLVVPILTTSVEPKDTYQLWGLLIAHQCQDTREWEKEELEFLNKLSVQLSISIQQAELIKFLNAELGLRKLAELEIQKRATELESVNKQLIKATSLLQKRNQELDEFAYIVSHDLKAPLRGISNLCTWLEEDLLDNIPEENKEQLHLMRSRVFRMTNMIDDLLKYSRVGRIKNEKNKLNLISFLEEIIDSISPPPHFKVEIDKDMPQTINADAISLQQVLSNLISNAVKYNHRQDGQVKISIEDQNIHLKFTVADNGMGIQPEYHQKIFQIFQTLESKNNKESTGIGLAIVKKIVETQGGKIWIDSQLGEGTTFSFTWSK